MSPSSKPSKRNSKKPKAGEGAICAISPELLVRMAESVAKACSVDEAVRDHLAVAQQISGARLVFVSRFDKAKKALAVLAVRGRIDETVVAAKLGEGPVGTAFLTRSIVNMSSHLAIPLIEAGEPIGVLSVVGARALATPEVWQAITSHLIAAQIAANARESALRRNRDLETAVAGLRSLERARDELLGNVSHELKSPLTTIKAYLAMARKDRLGDLTEKQKRSFEVCDRNADRLLRLINDMLLTTRLQAGRMSLASKPIGLRSLAQEVLQALAPLAATNRVNIVLQRGGEIFVKGDRERLLEALTHLAENAIIHGSVGGQASISLTSSPGVALLEVRDTGQGIHPDDLHHVFDRFFRQRGGGSRIGRPGLGLAIVRQIVQLHGGTVSAKSTLGVGSTFTISLPLFAAAVRPDSEFAETRVGAILLVEDDDDCREVLVQVLEAEGLSVVAAGTSADAIKILSTLQPALILLDLRLGESDGRLVLEHVRFDPRLAQTPVFVISGATESAAGFHYEGPERIDGFFEKPLNLPRLLSRIREVVRPLSHAAQ